MLRKGITRFPEPKEGRLPLSLNSGVNRRFTVIKDSINGSERMFYSVSEVSEMFGVCQKTVYRLLDRGLVQASSALRHKRISKASIDQFIAGTCNGGGR